MIGWLVVTFMVGLGSGAFNYRVGFTHGRRVGDGEGFERGLGAGAPDGERIGMVREWRP